MVYNNDLHINNIGKTDCITLGRIAPDFTASSTQGPITLSQYRGKWVVLFYEADIDWLFDILQYTGIKITFPLISDRNAEVARLYDIVNPDRIYEVSVRDAFIISPAQNIRAIISYPISCGLNIYEMLRVIDSLQTTDQFNVYTPSNWMPGDPVLVRAPQTFEEAIQMWNSQEGLEISCSMWYYCYRYLNSNNNPGSNNTNL